MRLDMRLLGPRRDHGTGKCEIEASRDECWGNRKTHYLHQKAGLDNEVSALLGAAWTHQEEVSRSTDEPERMDYDSS